MTQQEIEKLAMKETRKLADKEYSIHEAKMGSLFVAASFKNPADKIKWDFTEGFIAGAKSQSMSEWVELVKASQKLFGVLENIRHHVDLDDFYIEWIDKVINETNDVIPNESI